MDNQPETTSNTQPINHEQTAKAVLKKIQRVYQLTDQESALPAVDYHKLGRANLTFVTEEQWTKTGRAALQFSNVPDDKYCDMKLLAKTTMDALGNALHLSESVKRKEESAMHSHQRDFYAYSPHRQKITDAYISHLTNDLFDKLRMLGLDDNSARRVVGVSIRGAIMSYRTVRKTRVEEDEHEPIIIRPEINHTTNKPAAALIEELGEMRNYWRNLYNELNHAHGINYGRNR